MRQISAWIRDPTHNLFKGMSKHCHLFRLYCEAPETCDLYVKDKSCLHCGAVSPCKFGRKSETQGPTRAARSFYSTIQKWKEENKEYLDKLGSLKAYNRIIRMNGHYYLPYSHMAKDIWGSGNPLESKWVPEAEMTTELLQRLCTARPYASFGGEITAYQKKEVPKFIVDLKMFYPDIFERLPEEQKARVQTISYIGRKADITTCEPGPIVISKTRWEWDGEHLIGRSMIFPPVKGDIEIRIKPKPGESVEITDNCLVGANTRFLD